MPTNTHGIVQGLKVKSGFLNPWDSQVIGDTAHGKHQVIKDHLALVRGRSSCSQEKSFLFHIDVLDLPVHDVRTAQAGT